MLVFCLHIVLGLCLLLFQGSPEEEMGNTFKMSTVIVLVTGIMFLLAY